MEQAAQIKDRFFPVRGKICDSRPISLSSCGKRNGSWIPKRKDAGPVRGDRGRFQRGSPPCKCWHARCSRVSAAAVEYRTEALRSTPRRLAWWIGQAAARAEAKPFRGRQGAKKYRSSQRPFLSYTGRGAFFLFGKTKRKNGGRVAQLARCEQEREHCFAFPAYEFTPSR